MLWQIYVIKQNGIVFEALKWHGLFSTDMPVCILRMLFIVSSTYVLGIGIINRAKNRESEAPLDGCYVMGFLPIKVVNTYMTLP